MAKVVRWFNVKYTVAGSGSFPIDMLRYDTSFPEHETESLRLEDRNRLQERREVDLVHRGEKEWSPTVGRWNSFGWGVVAIEAAVEVVG